MPKAKRKAVAKQATPAKPRAKPKTRSNTKAKSEPKAEAATAKPPGPPLFFWKETEREAGFLSPWYRSPFQLDGVTYDSAAQCILAQKAKAFGDEETLRRVLATTSADELRSLGDDVEGFDEYQWNMQGPIFAQSANLAKFTGGTASKDLLKRLNDLGERELVLADPTDRFFGIGFEADAAEEVDRKQWGANIFGKSLDAVRKRQTQAQDTNKESPFDKPGGKMNVYW